MKLGEEHPDLDDIDRQILALMQEIVACRSQDQRKLASAPSVMERQENEDGASLRPNVRS
jgi:hypothetical protein